MCMLKPRMLGSWPMTDQGCLRILQAQVNLQRNHLADFQMCEGSSSPGNCIAVLQLFVFCFLRTFLCKPGLPIAWCR